MTPPFLIYWPGKMNLILSKRKCGIMEWGTNRVQKADKKKKSRFALPFNQLFSLVKFGRGDWI